MSYYSNRNLIVFCSGYRKNTFIFDNNYHVLMWASKNKWAVRYFLDLHLHKHAPGYFLFAMKLEGTSSWYATRFLERHAARFPHFPSKYFLTRKRQCIIILDNFVMFCETILVITENLIFMWLFCKWNMIMIRITFISVLIRLMQRTNI